MSPRWGNMYHMWPGTAAPAPLCASRRGGSRAIAAFKLKGVLMERKIELQEQPALNVVGKRFRTSMDRIQGDIGAGYGALFGYLGEMGEQPGGMPFALYFGPEFNPEDFEMELCVPVNRPLEGRGDIIAHEVPGGPAVVTMYKGPYSGIEPVYAEIDAWVKENGYEYAGPFREVYLNDPGQVPAEELLTEISVPVSRA